MLRVGLTGGLGSGKSTVAGYFRSLGAKVIEADELGRALMEPGQPVYAEIVRVFGPGVVTTDGHLNRAKLAELAFQGGRLNELNAIVHPATIAAQGEWMREIFAVDPKAVAIVESALIFEVERDARLRGESETVLSNWRRRFDRIIVVTAPDEVKIARYIARVAPGVSSQQAQSDARSRMARQIPDQEKAARADYVLPNDGDLPALRAKVETIWAQLMAASIKFPAVGLLQ
jgi:dephospho-CoA kinase